MEEDHAIEIDYSVNLNEWMAGAAFMFALVALFVMLCIAYHFTPSMLWQ